jgi:hypothetical protein
MAKISQKGPKKGLFWGFLKYMVNRPTFLRLVVLGRRPPQKGADFWSIFDHFLTFLEKIKKIY